MIWCWEMPSSDSRSDTLDAFGLASDANARSSAPRVASGNRREAVVSEEGVFFFPDLGEGAFFETRFAFVADVTPFFFADFGDFGDFGDFDGFAAFADFADAREEERPVFRFFFGLAGPQPPVFSSSASPSNASPVPNISSLSFL